ncbi:phosphoglucosamine mutase, partial [Candidatus Micrarchaeota archaeon]|nr:phosphoglucosamine mutase [Candidatus Micrarchaeota archaeon]
MLFGTSGIRGNYGNEITPKLSMGIANAFPNSNETVAIASDLRETSDILKKAAISGIIAKGADVVDLGEVPTPTFAFYTQKNKCRGIMITASHNPSEYNGLKLYRNGREIGKNEEKEVEEKYAKGIKPAKWDEVGKYSIYENSVQDHIAMIEKNVDMDAIRKAKLKVVLDCNGVGSRITPLLLENLGCEIIEINKVKRGFLRPSEPNEENLKELCDTMKNINANLGIAHDGDADRAIFVDETGELVGLDVQFAIAIEKELERKKGKIVSTVEASLLIKETIERNKGENVVVAVGSTYVSETMEKEKNVVFGGEPAGEFIYKDGVNTPDGIMAAAKFLEICAQTRLSELKRKYKT